MTGVDRYSESRFKQDCLIRWSGWPVDSKQWYGKHFIFYLHTTKTYYQQTFDVCYNLCWHILQTKVYLNSSNNNHHNNGVLCFIVHNPYRNMVTLGEVKRGRWNSALLKIYFSFLSCPLLVFFCLFVFFFWRVVDAVFHNSFSQKLRRRDPVFLISLHICYSNILY